MLCTCKSYKIKWEWEFAMACPRSGSSSTVSRLNWNLEMLVFMEGGKPENSAKNLSEEGENQQQTQPTYDTGSGNRTQATSVGDECFHHCVTHAPLLEEKESQVNAGSLSLLIRLSTVNSRTLALRTPR